VIDVRRALAIALSAVIAAVPTVALAADGDSDTYVSGQTGGPSPVTDKKLVARQRADHLRKRHARKAARAKARSLPDVAVPPQLTAIAACESGGNPAAVGGGGQLRGKYQFTYATWAAVGGQGDPAAAPEAEQDRRAALLYAQAGAGQWPVCGA
jgi:hypothetical protein